TGTRLVPSSRPSSTQFSVSTTTQRRASDSGSNMFSNVQSSNTSRSSVTRSNASRSDMTSSSTPRNVTAPKSDNTSSSTNKSKITSSSTSRSHLSNINTSVSRGSSLSTSTTDQPSSNVTKLAKSSSKRSSITSTTKPKVDASSQPKSNQPNSSSRTSTTSRSTTPGSRVASHTKGDRRPSRGSNTGKNNRSVQTGRPTHDKRTSGFEPGTQTAGTYSKTQASGFDSRTKPEGSKPGTSAGGADPGTQTEDADSVTCDTDAETQTDNADPHIRHGKTTKKGDRAVTAIYFQLEDLSPVSLEKTFRTELNLPDSRPDHSTPIIIDDDDSVYRARSEAQMMVTRGSIPSQRRSSATQLKESDSVDSHVATTTTHIGSSFQVTTTTSTRRMAAATAASEAAELHLVHPVTGEKISFHQAVQDGLVDLTSGTLTHPSTGENIPLSEAVERGYVSPILLQHLDTPCGIIDPATGRELTLLQATKRGLYSPEEGSFKDPTTGKLLTPEEASKIGFIILEKVSFFTQLCVPVVASLSLYDAIVEGHVNVRTGEFTVPTVGEKIPMTQAFARGFISAEPSPVLTSGISLSEAISQGFIDDYSGQAVDRNSGNKYTLDEAVEKGLLASHVREVVNSDTGCKLTVAEAIQEGVLDVTAGRYVNNVTGQKLLFSEAVQEQLICRPYTLKDCSDLKLLDNKGHIQDPQIKDHIPLLEAVGKGIVDVDLKSVKDTASKTLLTLPEAFMFSVLLPEGMYRDTESGEVISLVDAVNRGFITSVSTKTIFDIDGIKDPETGDYISFKIAVLKGVINPKTGLFTDPRTGNTMSLEEAVSVKMIQPQILETLKMDIGMTDDEGKEMNVVEAVLKGRLDPNIGQILDPKTGKPVALEDAVNRRLISPEGAATLRGLLSVTVTTATITKTIKRYVTVKSTGIHTTESRVTLQEAKHRGLINEAQGTYHDPESDKTIPLDEAIQQGLVTLSTEWPSALPDASPDDSAVPISPIRETMKRHLSPAKSPSPIKSARTSITPDKESLERSPHSSPSKTPDRMSSPTKTPDRDMRSLRSSPSKSPERILGRTSRTTSPQKTDKEISSVGSLTSSPSKTPERIVSPTKSGRPASPEKVKDKGPSSPSKTPERTVSPMKTSRPTSPDKRQRPGSLETIESLVKDQESPTKLGRTSPVKESIKPGVSPTSPTKPVSTRPDSLFQTVNGSQEGSPIKSQPESPVKSSSSRQESPYASSRGESPVKSFGSRPDSPMKSSGIGPESPLKTDESVPTSPDKGMPGSSIVSPERPPRKIKSTLRSPADSVDSAMGNVDDTDMTSSGASLTGTTTVFNESYSAKTRTLELPPEGWYLKEAIDEKLYDPVMGLFTIPATDRLVSFEECVKIGIIDSRSAEVIDPKNGRKITLTRALDKNVLDCTGKYPDESNPDRRLTMKEAITKKLIILKDRTEEVTDYITGRVIQITTVEGQPDKVQVSGSVEGGTSSTFREIRTNEPVVDTTLVEIKPGMTFDPTEGNVQLDDGSVLDVVTAVKEGKIQPTGVKVKDPYSGRDLNLSEAIRKGIIDKDSGEYKDKTGRKLSLTDAAKYGILGVAAVIGAPVIAGVAAAQAIKKGIKKVKRTDPKTGAEITFEESVEIITDSTPEELLESVVSKRSHTTIKSTTVVETDVILQDPVTGKEITPEEAFSRGLISPEELEEIRSTAHGKIQEVEKLAREEADTVPEEKVFEILTSDDVSRGEVKDEQIMPKDDVDRQSLGQLSPTEKQKSPSSELPSASKQKPSVDRTPSKDKPEPSSEALPSPGKPEPTGQVGEKEPIGQALPSESKLEPSGKTQPPEKKPDTSARVLPSEGKPEPSLPSADKPQPPTQALPSEGEPEPSELKPEPTLPSEGKPEPSIKPLPSEGKPEPSLPSEGKPEPSLPSEGKPEPSLPSEGKPEPSLPSEGKPEPSLPSEGKPEPSLPSEPEPFQPSEGKPEPSTG
ncbi:Plectin-like 1, partial [Homarus americanus]